MWNTLFNFLIFYHKIYVHSLKITEYAPTDAVFKSSDNRGSYCICLLLYTSYLRLSIISIYIELLIYHVLNFLCHKKA